jgi:thiol:disulfide interchange protein DsbD
LIDPFQPSVWLADLFSRHGFWWGLPAVFLVGLGLNLTPCVYPMIPVTLAFFSHQASGNVRRAVQLAVVYVLGMSLNYALLGVIAARTGMLFGSWLQQPLVLVAIAAMITSLALSLFGLYELRLPSAIANRFGQASTGLWGAFVMGLLVGFVAAPCIGPVVLALLLIVGQIGNPVGGFLLFFIMGLGMGLPYVVLAVAVHRVKRLPKAGRWLIWVKRLLGVALLGVAFFFVRPLIFKPEPSVGWAPYREAVFEEAQRAGRPVIIDVYADWCVPCVEMDHVTFRHPDVVRALAPVTTMRLDVTSDVSPEGERLLERYQVYGAPTVLFFDRTGRERTELRLLGFVKPAEFLERFSRLQGGG